MMLLNRASRALWATLALLPLHGLGETFAEQLSKRPNQLELNPQLGIRVAPGFSLARVADDQVAPNIQCFTLDSLGRPIVSGPGYIRLLKDVDGDGVFEDYTEFASSKSGAFGMAWINGALFASADDSIAVYRDRDGNDMADGLPQRLFSVHTGETGANAIRLGADGYVYLIGGAEAEWERMDPGGDRIGPDSLNKGAVVRFREDGSELSVYSSGLHAPYDFDFGAHGEILYFETDHVETLFAPWNPGARLIAARPFADHGARPGDFQTAYPRHDQALDGAQSIERLGRANPLAPTVYRAHRFPLYFRSGVFTLDWTFGRLVFYPLERSPGGIYHSSKGNLLFEPVEGTGITPCDLEIAPDGSLLIATGGRGASGALFRFDVTEDAANPPATASELEAVLEAPAPQSAWSKEAQRELLSLLGKERLLEAIFRIDFPVAQRQRAIEILVDTYGGLPNAALQELARDESGEIRATAAWAWNYQYSSQSPNLLLTFLRDPNPDVRAWAARGWRARPETLGEKNATAALRALFSDPHPRVREIGSAVAKALPDQLWESFLDETRFTEARAGIALTHARFQRDGATEALAEIIDRAAYWTRASRDPFDRFQALCLWIRTLGDWDVDASRDEELWIPFRLGSQNGVQQTWLQTHKEETEKYLRGVFPTRRLEIDREMSRLLAMLDTEDALLRDKLSGALTSVGSARDRWHYLSAIAALSGDLGSRVETIASATLSLNSQLASENANPKAQSGLSQIVAKLIEKDERLGRLIVDDSSFYQKPRLSLVPALPEPIRQEAARGFLEKLEPSRIVDPDPALVEAIAVLPIEEIEGLLAALWGFAPLQNAIVEQLARRPQITDLNLFFDGLESGSDSTIQAAAIAIGSLAPGEQAGQVLARLVRALRRSVPWQGRDNTRASLLEAASQWSGGTWAPDAENTNFSSQVRSLEQWFETHHPESVAAAQLDPRDDPISIRNNLEQVAWERGDALLGQEIYTTRCASCHKTPARFGPTLEGWALGQDPRDAMLEVIFPHRRIAPGYEAIVLRLHDGRTVYGLPASEGPEGDILTVEPGSTLRIGAERVAQRGPAPFSVMPGGLLSGLGAADVANLFAYLQLL